MKKRGFTLIETIATIVIIAVVATITTPIVLNQITAVKDKAFEENELKFLNVAKGYTLVNNQVLPQELGERIYITLEDMINDEMIEDIISPYSEESCDPTESKVGVTNIGTEGFIYQTLLSCSSVTSDVDLNAPVITINGDNPYIIEKEKTYVEAGATATDSVDGNIEVLINSSLVNMSEVGIYDVEYIAIDKSGNSSKEIRKVDVREDLTAPLLSLNGGASITTEYLQPFTDPGYTSIDNRDGDITGTVVVTGSVDTSILGNQILTYTSTDAYSNQTVVTRIVNVIDTVAPAAPSFTQNTNAPVNTNVILTITYTPDSNFKQYKIGSGSWQVYTAPITINDNETIYARGVDASSNISLEKTHVVSNIDKIKPLDPSINVSTTVPTNSDVIATINYSADSTLKQYKVDSGSWQTYTTPVSMTANGIIYARGRDIAGNYSESVLTIINNIDKTLPNSPSISISSSAPTNGTITATASYSADSVLKQYKIGTGSWQTYSSGVTISENGLFYARSRDEAGNYSLVSNLNITNIDKTPPIIPGLVPSTTSPTNSDVTVTGTFPADAIQKQYLISDINTTSNYGGKVITNSNYSTSWDNALHTGAITVSGWGAGYNGGVTEPANGYHAMWTLGGIDGPTDPVIKYQDLNNAFGYGHRWLGVSSLIDLSETSTWQTGDKIILSWAQKSDTLNKGARVGLYHYRISTGTRSFEACTKFIGVSAVDTWETVSYECDVTSNWDLTKSIYIYSYGHYGDYGTLYVDNLTASKVTTDWTNYASPFAVSNNGVVFAEGEDVAGNTSDNQRLFVTNIDKIAPVNATIVQNPLTVTNGNVIATISYPTDASVKLYKIGSGSWSTYTTPVSVSSNNTVYAMSSDVAGNWSSAETLTVSNIDKIAPSAPTLVKNPTSITNGNVTVTITYSGDSTLRQYKIGTGSWTNYTAPLTITTNATIYGRGRDAAGNYSSSGSISVGNIDKIKPTVPLIEADVTAPTNGNVAITITYSGDTATKQYKINSGSWTTYTVPLTVTSNRTVYARGLDAAGNISDEVSKVVSNIDKTAPAIPTLSPSTTAATNGNVTVTVTYSGDSTLKQYRVGSSGTWTNYSSAVTLTANNTLYARGRDAAGNYSPTGTIIINNIDKTVPSQPSAVLSTVSPTKSNITATVTYSGDSALRQYKIGTGSWTTYTAPVTITSNTTLYTRGRDAAGNYSAERSTSITNIDKTAPSGTFSPNSQTAWTKNNINVVLNPSDSGTAGVYRHRYRYSTNNGSSYGSWSSYTNGDTNFTFPILNTGKFKVQMEVTDNAGNSNILTSGTYNVDKTAPTIAISGSSPYEMTVGGTFTDPGYTASDNYDTSVSVSKNSIATGTSGTYTLTYTATDDAGNTATANRTVYVWSNWSSWSTSSVSTTSTRQVETGKRYQTQSWVVTGSSYNTCRTSACGVDYYNSCTNSACGVSSTVYNSCRTSACGVQSTTYKSCITPACGISNTVYAFCRTSGCGVDTVTYKSCSSSSCPGGSVTYNYCMHSECGPYYRNKLCSTSACGQSGCCNPTTGECKTGSCYGSYTYPTYYTCRASACGTEQAGYASCRTAGCGIQSETYGTCRTSACGVESTTYNFCRNSACGVDWHNYNSCRNSACGVESTTYNSCRTSSCGVSYYNYNSCRTSACGVAQYKSCATSACGSTDTYGWGSASSYQYTTGSCPTSTGSTNVINCGTTYRSRTR